MLNWANQFSIFCLLDNNHYQFEAPAFEFLLGIGARRSIHLTAGTAFKDLQEFYDCQPSWLFGHLGFGLQKETEKIKSEKKELIPFGDGFFFEPEILIRLNGNAVEISSEMIRPEDVWHQINETPAGTEVPESSILIQKTIDRPIYTDTIRSLLAHIKRGDCYEINFCQSFFAEDARIDPIGVYRKLVSKSPTPFAALYKLDHLYCICASPERYLKKTGDILISQPIKGTSKRDLQNAVQDKAAADYLLTSQKERSENVMVVDLVRNDLSRVSQEGSVSVTELFGIYPFPQVYQMISTVQGKLMPHLKFTDALKASFPMGSMTGAPKKRVLELIDEYEVSGRGLFSGSIGYINPAADFDFNVVIRSLFYDQQQSRLSFSAGGGITYGSDPEAEYDECLLKASAIVEVLNG
jgi:para-aminobenzoate synthetase component 1